MNGMRRGLSVPNFAEPDSLVELAVATDRNGWDGFFLWDHILVDRAEAVPVSEPWTVLAAAATATTRVRLGTLVTPVARRRPWVLARQVTTVDHLSRGRAVLGVGLGVPPDAEYGAFGESEAPRDHAARLDEGLAIIDALWTGERVDHLGPAHHLDGVRFAPVPIQRPRGSGVVGMLAPRPGGNQARRQVGRHRAGLRDAGGVPPGDPGRGGGHRRRDLGGPSARHFDVVVWAVAPDEGQRAAYADAGATWLIEGPAPGDDWLDDAAEIATAGPPHG